MKKRIIVLAVGTLICATSLISWGFNDLKIIGNNKNDWSLQLGKEGHGGQSVVCRDKSNNIISAELFDFFEAPVMYGQKIIESQDSVDQQLERVAKKMEAAIRRTGFYTKAFSEVEHSITFTNKTLKKINDSLEVIEPPAGCEVEQLAIYIDPTLILVNEDIWAHLPLTHRAGLIAHEAIYFDARVFSETDSRRTRKIVGHLFSSFQFVDIYADLPMPVLRCVGSNNEDQSNPTHFDFFMYPEGEKTRLQFRQIDGRIVFSKKTLLINKKFPLNLEHEEREWGQMNQTESNFEAKDSIGIRVFADPVFKIQKQIQLIDVNRERNTGLINFTCKETTVQY